MTIDTKFISRQEAAKVLGVCEQTISNYVKKGLFRYKKFSNVVFIDRADFEKNKARLIKVHECEDEIDKYERTLKARKEKVRQDLEAFIGEDKFGMQMSIINRMARMAIDSFMVAADLNEKDRLLLESLKNDSASFVASRDGGSAHKMMRIMYDYMQKVNDTMDSVVELRRENRELKAKVYKQHLENERLRKGQKVSGSSIDDERAALMNTKLTDLGASVRLLNVMKANDIDTIGDLVQYKKRDLLNFRMMGRKTFFEIEELLESLGLELGTDIQNYVRQ